ncbi:hypothetical protein CN685_26940 [Bacillus wiedmannii]|nr:hypothetical protein CN685_26940 [Bacillus wiedmannii]
MNSCLQTKTPSNEFAYLVCEFRRCFFHVPLFGFTSNSGEVFSLCLGHSNENKVNDITSNKSTNVVKGEGS